MEERVGVVAAAHLREHGVAARLQGEVEVPAEPRVLPAGQQLGG